MSTFERDEYKWRETYFVLFESAKRPSLKKIEATLRDADPSDLDARFCKHCGASLESGR